MERTPVRRRRRFRPPLRLRRQVTLATLDEHAWDAIVAEAEQAFRRRGIHRREASGRRWLATRPGRGALKLSGRAADEGAIVAVTYKWPRPRPWLSAVAWLCWPTALVVGAMLVTRPSPLADWLAAGALVGVPVVAALAAGAIGWWRWGVVRWRMRRVLRKARAVAGAWANAWEVENEREAGHLVPVLPTAVGPSEWLSATEIETLTAQVPSSRPRRALPTVARTTKARRSVAALPDGFTEWRPTPAP